MIMAQHPRIQEQDSCNDKSKITSTITTSAHKTEGVSAISQRLQPTKQQTHQNQRLVASLTSSSCSNHLPASQLAKRMPSAEQSQSKAAASAGHIRPQQQQMQQKVATGFQGLRPSSRHLQNQQSGAAAASTTMKPATTTAAGGGDKPSRRQPLEQSGHQQQAQQDGKRTLIKNQLYLIEHLQLENASLRNERDQLQLENEELKFQLQMIR